MVASAVRWLVIAGAAVGAMVDPSPIGAQEAMPAAAMAVTPLVAVLLPLEEQPSGALLTLVVWQATVAPGAEVAFTAAMVGCCPGPQVDHVLAGELTVRAAGPLRIVRAAAVGTPGPSEEASPGIAVVLRPGDGVFHRAETPIAYANAGPDPVQLVSGELVRGARSEPPPGYQINNEAAARILEPSLPAGPERFVLEAVMLPPLATLPGPPPGVVCVLTWGPATAFLAEAGDGSVTNVGPDPAVAYDLSLVPVGAEERAATPAPLGMAAPSGDPWTADPPQQSPTPAPRCGCPAAARRSQ